MDKLLNSMGNLSVIHPYDLEHVFYDMHLVHGVLGYQQSNRI